MVALETIGQLQEFLLRSQWDIPGPLNGVSLFAGAGLSDIGYECSGIHFVVHVELEKTRASLGESNFARSKWIVGDVCKSASDIIDEYSASTDSPLDVIVATPPCQGMSSSNPSRGKRQTPQAHKMEEKNGLVLGIIPIVCALKPRIVIVENVRQLLTLSINRVHERLRAVDLLSESLPEYHIFEGVVNVADYGIPQDRRRAIIVAVRRKEPWLEFLTSAGRLPWPAPTHSQNQTDGRLPWTTLREWFNAMNYEQLDSASASKAIGTHPLHFVPFYDENRYQMVSGIPANSGRNAYCNVECIECSYENVPLGTANCPQCGAMMRSRPIVIEDGRARLIKGFASSYRRMHPLLPASTVTTNSSHIGSDFKIHPWENRVLSILECADLQTVPRSYDWSFVLQSGRSYTVRQAVGEAFPPYFTYRHGQLLRRLLLGDRSCLTELAPINGPGLGHRKTPSVASNHHAT